MSDKRYSHSRLEDMEGTRRRRTSCPNTFVVSLIAIGVCVFFIGGVALGYYIRHMNFEETLSIPQQSDDEDESLWSPINVEAMHNTFLLGDNGKVEKLYNELR